MKKGSKKEFDERREILIDSDTLKKRIKQLGKEITKDYDGKKITVVCVLKGAIYFLTDLTKHIKLDTRIELIRVSSYAGENSTGNICFMMKLDEPVAGKDVLVVEDIVDTGNTMAEVLDYLKSQHPNSLKLCALLDKSERRIKHGIVPDYVGFVIPNRFVVGYGLDLNEKYRNLPDIECVVKTTGDIKQIENDRDLIKLQLKQKK